MRLLTSGALALLVAAAAGCGGRTPLDLGQDPLGDGGLPLDGGVDAGRDGGGPPPLLSCDVAGPERLGGAMGERRGTLPTLARAPEGALLVYTDTDAANTPRLFSQLLDEDGALLGPLAGLGVGVGGRVVAIPPGAADERYALAYRELSGGGLRVDFLEASGASAGRGIPATASSVTGTRPGLAANEGALALAWTIGGGGGAPPGVQSAFFPYDAMAATPQLSEPGTAASLAPVASGERRFALATALNREARFKTVAYAPGAPVEVETSDAIVFDGNALPLAVQVVGTGDPDGVGYARTWAARVDLGGGAVSTRLGIEGDGVTAEVSIPSASPIALEAAADDDGAFVAAVASLVDQEAAQLRGRLLVLGPGGRAFQAPIFSAPAMVLAPAVVGVGPGRFLIVLESPPDGLGEPLLQRYLVTCDG